MSERVKSKNKSGVQVVEFVEELKREFHRISWTPRDELITYTKIVVTTAFLSGFGVYGVDVLIQGVFEWLRHVVT